METNTLIIILCVAGGGVAFWLGQLWHVLHRNDRDFAGRSDKLIWTIVVLFGSVFGALLYWLSRQKVTPNVAPTSSESLRREYVDAVKRRDAKADGGRGAG